MRVLNNRVKGMTEGSVMEEEGGLRSGVECCTDPVFAIKQVNEKMVEKDRVMFTAFIDIEKVYDSVHTEKLWRTLSEYGVRGNLLR